MIRQQDRTIFLTKLFCGAMLLLLMGQSHAQHEPLPAFARYQVPFGEPVSDWKEAIKIKTQSDRRTKVLQFMACGQELAFFAVEGSREAQEDMTLKPTADIYPTLVAKVGWISSADSANIAMVELGSRVCSARIRYFDPQDFDYWWSLPKTSDEHGSNHVYTDINNWPPKDKVDETILKNLWNEALKNHWGDKCTDIVKQITKVPNSQPAAYDFDLSVTEECMAQQINASLMRRVKVGNPGTSGLPCTFVDSAGKGDWDMAVISLLRVLYLDRRSGRHVIKEDTVDHVFSNLLSISGRLESESYGLHECGNTENDTGSPQERSDEDDFYDNDFFGGLGDIFEWLAKWLLVVAYAAIAIGVVGLIAGPIVAATVGLAASVAIAGATLVRIPETENHLLMINTSRYLTNQLRIELLADEDDKQKVREQNIAVREWLLQRLQRISREDFMEYNSKPYQRLSIASM